MRGVVEEINRYAIDAILSSGTAFVDISFDFVQLIGGSPMNSL